MATFSYDALNRRIGGSYVDATTSFVYDGGGRLVQATDSAGGTIVNQHDALDRLLAQSTNLGTVSHQYDGLGRRTTMTAPGQPPVSYGYDAASRLTAITQASQLVQLEYDAAGRRTKLTLPNQVSTESQYDAASRLTALLYRNAGGVLGDLTYQYDAAGNRTRVGGSFARTLLPDPVATATYDTANRQLAFGAANMTFDTNGSLLTTTGPTGATSFTWDARNRLRALMQPVHSATFVYDAMGRRAAGTVDGVATRYLYDGLDIAEDRTDTTAHAYLRTLVIDEPLVRAGSEFYLSDALGSTITLAANSGVVVTTYTYAPFGVSAAAGASTTNPLTYTARETDPTALSYYRARFYDATLSRFISEDPIGFADGGMNPYAYVANNPIRSTDPLGLWGIGIIGGGAAVVGAGPVGPSAGTTASSGVGLFGGGSQGLNVGAFTSLGGFSNLGAAGNPGSNFGFGAFAGLGGGAFLTNATSATDLEATTGTASLDVGIGLVKASIQLSYGEEIWSISATFGPGSGLSLGNLGTTTTATGIGGRK